MTRAQRRLLTATVTCALMGVFIAGGLLGYRWSNDTHHPTRPAAKAPVTTAATQGVAPVAEPASRMPDVIGLTQTEALEALADIGVDSRDVEVTEQPYVGEPGLVAIQSPVRGTSNPDSISLKISTEATMPDLAGKTLDESTTALEAFGAIALVNERYDPAATPGTVLATLPASGATVTPTVAVTVAAAASSIFVDAVDPDRGGCSTGTATAGGTTTDHALVCSAQRRYASSSAPSPAASYVLSRNVDRFRATLAISDDGTAGDRVRVRVRLNGAATDAFDQVVAFGTPVTLDIDTTGALNLQIYVESPEVDPTNWNSPSLVLVDPTFLGLSANLDKLPLQ